MLLRSTFLLQLALATLSLADPVNHQSRRESQFVDRSSSSHSHSYAKVSGMRFEVDGSTQYIVGANAYYLPFLENNADIDLVFSHLNSSGLKVLRVWGFNDISKATSGVWFQSLIPGQPPAINTGANGLQRLDYVVSSAEKHGVKLIIPLVNHWENYGGFPTYHAYYGTNDATWYTDEKVQAQYRKYAKAVISRYTSSTAIFAWNLVNELRCRGCPVTTVFDWATKTSAYFKSIDPNHMVALGDEGLGGGEGAYPYTAAEGIDFVANLQIPDLDFGTFHLYATGWGQTGDWGTEWVRNRGQACALAKKPCLFEEYGPAEYVVDGKSPWQAAALASPGVAGDTYWQYGDTLSTGQTPSDGYTVSYGTDKFKLVTDHVAAAAAAPAHQGT